MEVNLSSLRMQMRVGQALADQMMVYLMIEVPMVGGVLGHRTLNCFELLGRGPLGKFSKYNIIEHVRFMP
jgi:hypothetical protein